MKKHPNKQNKDDEVHDSLKRLHEISGIKAKGLLAKQLGYGPSVITNWAARGVSKEGALLAAEIYNSDANYILHGHQGKHKSITLPVLSSISIKECKSRLSDNPNVCDWIKPNDHLPSNAFGFLVTGRVMQPQFNVNDIAVIDTSVSLTALKDGDYVLVQAHDGLSAILRQVIIGDDANNIFVQASNPLIPNEGILPIADFHLLGVVDHKITKLR